MLDRIIEILESTPTKIAAELVPPSRERATRQAALRPAYEGDVRSRDSAYHQGTVWPWLLGAIHYGVPEGVRPHARIVVQGEGMARKFRSAPAGRWPGADLGSVQRRTTLCSGRLCCTDLERRRTAARRQRGRVCRRREGRNSAFHRSFEIGLSYVVFVQRPRS
jgi:amylo-alpha-1,6-glucosidase